MKKHCSKLSDLMVLPPVIFSKNDLHVIQYFTSKPNFITSQQISGNIIILNNFKEKKLLI